MARRPYLHALAQRYGILPSYIDQEGTRHETPDASYVALLGAMGVEAATEQTARCRLEHDAEIAAAQLIAPVHVTPAPATTVAINAAAVPGAKQRPIEWELHARLEGGMVQAARGRGSVLRLPSDLPHGYHTLHVRAARSGASAITAQQRLIITPRQCVAPRALIGDRRVFGLLANLYTMRSARNWGIGDGGDLRALLRWSGKIGAAFVGINPLHALGNTGTRISPYDPISRLFRNILYLDIADVPELKESPAAARHIASNAFQRALHAARTAEQIDYERVLTLKRSVLEPLYHTFARQHRGRTTPRGRAYERYRLEQGQALQDFATFEALREHWTRLGRGADWHRWPAAYHDCRAPAVERFRQQQREAIDFHCYLQFALDQQLAGVARTARREGVPIGMYQDLAIGSAGDGSDTWAFRHLFVDRVSVGAPPDNYNAAGQNWSFPPIHPQHLRARGYDYYVRLLRQAMRHSGALRIDHVMGMVRQYWIPAGAAASAGAYVRMASDELFGILALESNRAGALIVGEDLGTVPPELPAMLERWGVLSTRVFYFERNRRGGYRGPREYPARALVSANTHDLPPIAGFIEGSDLTRRAALGLLADDAALLQATAQRACDMTAMLRRLSGLLEGSASALPGIAEAMPSTSRRRLASPTQIRDAIHAFLSATPAQLLGIALDDLAGEREPVNIPGVGVERHPNWSRRMTRGLETLRSDPSVARSLRRVRARHWKKTYEPR